MNEKLKELIDRAGWSGIEEIERFAELVEEEERKECAKQYLEITRDAVKKAILREREECAKLCDDRLKIFLSSAECAAAIRGRTE